MRIIRLHLIIHLARKLALNAHACRNILPDAIHIESLCLSFYASHSRASFEYELVQRDTIEKRRHLHVVTLNRSWRSESAYCIICTYSTCVMYMMLTLPYIYRNICQISDRARDSCLYGEHGPRPEPVYNG